MCTVAILVQVAMSTTVTQTSTIKSGFDTFTSSLAALLPSTKIPIKEETEGWVALVTLVPV